MTLGPCSRSSKVRLELRNRRVRAARQTSKGRARLNGLRRIKAVWQHRGQRGGTAQGAVRGLLRLAVPGA